MFSFHFLNHKKLYFHSTSQEGSRVPSVSRCHPPQPHWSWSMELSSGGLLQPDGFPSICAVNLLIVLIEERRKRRRSDTLWSLVAAACEGVSSLMSNHGVSVGPAKHSRDQCLCAKERLTNMPVLLYSCVSFFTCRGRLLFQFWSVVSQEYLTEEHCKTTVPSLSVMLFLWNAEQFV